MSCPICHMEKCDEKCESIKSLSHELYHSKGLTKTLMEQLCEIEFDNDNEDQESGNLKENICIMLDNIYNKNECERCFKLWDKTVPFFICPFPCNKRICKICSFKCACGNIICERHTKISFKIYQNEKETCGLCDN